MTQKAAGNKDPRKQKTGNIKDTRVMASQRRKGSALEGKAVKRAFTNAN